MSFDLLNATVFFDLVEVQQIGTTTLVIINISINATIAVVSEINIFFRLILELGCCLSASLAVHLRRTVNDFLF